MLILSLPVYHTCEFRQYCHVGNTAQQCRSGLFRDSDFAGDLEDSKSTSGETLYFWQSLRDKKSKRAKRLSQALVHLVIARASLFTDHEISGLPIRTKYGHFRTICEQTGRQFSNRSRFFFLELVVVNAWCCDFV